MRRITGLVAIAATMALGTASASAQLPAVGRRQHPQCHQGTQTLQAATGHVPILDGGETPARRNCSAKLHRSRRG